MRGAALLLALATLLAGCSAPASTTFHATAARPHVLQGYDYGGATAQPSEGTFEVTADAAADTGAVRAAFTFGGRAFVAAFTRFAEAPGRAFQEGGLRADFQEHGATGNGDAMLPQLHALSAGWGVGTMTVDGQAFADPATGAAEFAMHYMVTDTAPRDPETLQVLKADGQTPYDPAMPGDVLVRSGTLQVLLNIQSPAGATVPDTNLTLGDTVQEPQYSNSATFDVNATGALVSVNITLANPTPLPSIGQLSFVLSDPAGAEVGRFDYEVGPAAAPTGRIQTTSNATGTYVLTVSGAGLAVDYRADILVDYAEALFLHVVYADVRVG